MKDLKACIHDLHLQHGASVPSEEFTPELYELFLDFKEKYISDWMDADFFFVAANIDRYNEFYKERRT